MRTKASHARRLGSSRRSIEIFVAGICVLRMCVASERRVASQLLAIRDMRGCRRLRTRYEAVTEIGDLGGRSFGVGIEMHEFCVLS